MTSVFMDKEGFLGWEGEEKKHHIKGKRIVWEKEQIHEREEGIRGAASHLLRCVGSVGDELVAPDLRKLVFQTREFRLYLVCTWGFGKNFFVQGNTAIKVVVWRSPYNFSPPGYLFHWILPTPASLSCSCFLLDTQVVNVGLCVIMNGAL